MSKTPITTEPFVVTPDHIKIVQDWYVTLLKLRNKYQGTDTGSKVHNELHQTRHWLERNSN